MPSYRVVLTVGALAPGVQPPDVLPTAADAARELVTVEAYDVGVVSGEARLTVRFTADDDLRTSASTSSGVACRNVSTAPRISSRWGVSR